MRQIGTLPTQASADKFAAYLITQQIHATVEEDEGAWGIWVRDEDQLDIASQALEEYASNPLDAKYQSALREANAVLQAESKRREQARKKQVNMSDRWGRSAGRRSPLVTSIIIGTVLVFLLTMGGGQAAKRSNLLKFSDISKAGQRNYEQISQRLIDIRSGQVWRLVTPVFLHGGILHLAFNMYWLYILGTPIEQRKGALRLALLMFVVALLSTLAQALAPTNWGTFGGSPNVVGMSGVVYGLLGYLWIKGSSDPEDGLGVPQGILMFMLIWLFLGFAGILDLLLGAHVANLAHGIGMVVGMALGYLEARFRHGRQ